MNDRLHAVVAGSKGFVEAVDPHLRLRLGAPPAVARDAGEALRLSATRGLLVVEYGGPAWLDAVKTLRTSYGSRSLSIVAAVPAARLGDVDALQRAGVDEAVRWDARVDPVVWAVDRVVAARAAQPAQAPALANDARAGAADGFELRELTPVPGGAPRAGVTALTAVRLAPAQPAPAPVAPAAVIPAELPPDHEIAALLASAVQGVPPGDAALRDHTMRVAGALSDLERAALGGGEVPCDPAALRGAAVLRWRVAAVLERARATGADVDAAAAAALPAQIDEALLALKTAAAGLAPGALAAVSVVRNALVREAIELTDALARLAVGDVAPPPPRAVEPHAPATRVLSNEKSVEPTRRVHRGWAALLAIVALFTAGYHGHRWYERRALPAPVRLGGAPDGLAVHSAPAQPVSVLAGDPGRRVDPAQLEQFRREQDLKGMVVEEIAPGVLVVQPAPAGAAPQAQR